MIDIPIDNKKNEDIDKNIDMMIEIDKKRVYNIFNKTFFVKFLEVDF